MLWSAEDMLAGQCQRLNSPAHTRNVHNGLLQKSLEEDLAELSIMPHPHPPTTHSDKGLNCNLDMVDWVVKSTCLLILLNIVCKNLSHVIRLPTLLDLLLVS